MRLVAILLAVLVAFPAVAQDSSAPKTGAVQTLEGTTERTEIACIPTIAPAAAADEAKADLDRIQITGSRIGEHYGREWSDIEISLTIAILVLTCLLVGLVGYLAKTAEKAWSPQSILRVLGVVLIVPMAVMLVVAGYSEKQIASVIGLLGVIVGYLLGNGDKPRDT